VPETEQKTLSPRPACLKDGASIAIAPAAAPTPPPAPVATAPAAVPPGEGDDLF